MTTKEHTIELLKLIKHIENEKELLNSQLKLGIISADGASEELAMLNKKEKTFRRDLVLKNHITESGDARVISHHEPTDKAPKDYYITKLPNGKQMKAATYDKLIDKLFDFYTSGMCDFTLKSIFEAALLEKEVTENPKQNTIERIRSDFLRFFSEDFVIQDVRRVNDIELKKYIQKWVNDTHPKQKSFLHFKSILNLIFGYAYGKHIIGENPVTFVNNKLYIKSCDTRKAKPEEKILSPAEIDILKEEVRHRMTQDKYGSYYINGFALLFAIETGVRVGELCAIKWADVLDNAIHIHSQQLSRKGEGGKEYYLVPYTKNEIGESEDGRLFPLTQAIKDLLAEIKNIQTLMKIESEFIFCHEDGEWIKTDAYLTFLRRMCQSKNFKVTNNHALRMSLNSNVLLPMGISPADRAAMLGHSIETNLKYYSFAQKDYIDNVRALLDQNYTKNNEGNLGQPSKVIDFPQKKNSEPLISQAF